MPDVPDDLQKLESAIKDLELEYMKGWVGEEEYNIKKSQLRSRYEQLRGKTQTMPSQTAASTTSSQTPTQSSGADSKKSMVDPVTAVKRTIERNRRIPIERIAQESGVDAFQVANILRDLLDGRDLSGRIDRDAGDFILGTGTGPPPKSVVSCPYCRRELDRIAVKGETITCSVCKGSFIIS
ncbi:hypothetical protein EU537_09000 [Candidatus Thorarchaeota archaeon]|nr:MAG: hypothetical protein EU537_09000 [Candidatus Thorarchaeota archaeon]